MTFRQTLLIRFGLSVGLLLLVYFIVGSMLLRDTLRDMQEERLQTANSSLDHLVATSLLIYQETLDTNLRVAESKLQGELFLDASRILTYQAENQLTGEVREVELPSLVVSGEDGLQVLSKETAFVDRLTRLMGGTATVFQTFDGGLLRISTSVKRKDGTRAIETYIPMSSSVSKHILRGEGFRGRAYVVDRWYLTAYEPLLNAEGEIIGAIYVGIDQAHLDKLNEAVHAFQKGRQRIACIVDSEGTVVAGPKDSSLLSDLLLGFRETGSEPLSFLSPPHGESQTRTLEVRLDPDESPVSYRASFTPLAGIDWFAITAETVSSLEMAMKPAMLTFVLLTGMALIVLFGFILTVSNGIARPLNRLSEAVVRIASKDFDSPVPKGERVEELKKLSDAMESMAVDLKTAFTEMETARDRAEAAEKSQSTFLATMSHEIRTPMNAVLGMARLLHSTDLSDEQIGYVETIRTSGDILLNLINDILDYSKIESGKLEILPAPFLVEKCLHDVRDLLLTRAQDKGLRFSFEVGTGVPEVLIGDVDRLRQILINLCGNAIKFTREGEVTVTVSATSGKDEAVRLLIAVRDTGIGVPANQVHRLFTPFRQTGIESLNRIEGTGLGLTISQKLAQAMAGNITYFPVPSGGSKFVFTCSLRMPADPLLKLSKATPKREPFDRSLATRCPLKILVVEDNMVNQRVVSATLGKLGYDADQASDGEACLMKTESTSYDLILMDVQMPIMDGLEATRTLRAREGSRETRMYIVALSASVLASDRANALSAGMDDFVCKPIRVQELSTVIEQAWNHRNRSIA